MVNDTIAIPMSSVARPKMLTVDASKRKGVADSLVSLGENLRIEDIPPSECSCCPLNSDSPADNQANLREDLTVRTRNLGGEGHVAVVLLASARYQFSIPMSSVGRFRRC